MPQTQIFLLHVVSGCWGQIMVTKDKPMTQLQASEAILHQYLTQELTHNHQRHKHKKT